MSEVSGSTYESGVRNNYVQTDLIAAQPLP